MSIPWPKLLTRFTVPTGGWALTIKYSTVVGGQYGNSVTATVPAGNYYVSWDGQTDDFLWKLANVCNVALDSAALTDWVGRTQGITFWIDSSHKVHLAFVGTWFSEFANAHRDVQIDWTAGGGPSIAAVLGFSSSAALSLAGVDNPTATASWQHMYGWYASDDGQYTDDYLEDIDNAFTQQATNQASGHTKTAYYGSSYTNKLTLQFLDKYDTWSDEGDYGDTPTYPYTKNKALECWWREARQGIPFRVYRDSKIDTSTANEAGAGTADTTTTLTDTNKAWTTNQWSGRLLYASTFATVNDAATTVPMRYNIASNTSTALTVSASAPEPQQDTTNGTYAYFIFDQRYETYWLDTEKTKEFAPDELPDIERWNFSIALKRYQS